MACRLVNLHKFPLSIDLRGGETLVLAPGQTSRALLEESLYHNQHLPGWEAAGWVARLPAKFADTQPPPGVEKELPEAKASAEDEAPEETEADDDSDEDVESDAPHTKPRRRKKHR
jgi:hypothetical protein